MNPRPPMLHQKIPNSYPGKGWVVVAPGPSLDIATVQKVEFLRKRGFLVCAVQDAYRLVHWPDILYGCDAAWWDLHGERACYAWNCWSSHSEGTDEKRATADKYGLNLVAGRFESGFSYDQRFIHYGSNSGFQAVNLAILFGAKRIYLVGFDMRRINDKSHFFGEHPDGLQITGSYECFIRAFEVAARGLPAGIKIYNATPGSALRCFERASLDDCFDRVAA